MTTGIPQDFGDWISPILVKELRQGLRTRFFTISFISLQSVLLLFILAGLWEEADEDYLTGAFWFLLFLVLLGLAPLRGLNALSSEVKQNTLSLLSLTRLNGLRICFGKWAALFTQSLLFTVAVLPYVVLRYFSGGVDLLLELALLGCGLAGSAVLCAFSLVLSSLTNSITRTISVTGLVLFGLFGSGPFWLGLSSSSRGAGSLSGGWAWAGLCLLAVFLCFFCISAAASRIASAAENYSTLRRLLTLAGVVLCLVLAPHSSEELFRFLAYSLLGLLAADVFTEPSTSLPSVHAPFLRLGPAGRVPQFLLTPGWHSGAFLVLLVLAVLAMTADAKLGSELARWVAIHLSLGGVLLLPVLVTELLFRAAQDRFAPYFFIQMAQMALGGFFLMLGKGSKSESLLWLGSPLPSTSLFMALSTDHPEAINLPIVSGLSLLAILGLLVFAGRRHFQAILALRRPEV